MGRFCIDQCIDRYLQRSTPSFGLLMIIQKIYNNSIQIHKLHQDCACLLQIFHMNYTTDNSKT